jgi:hypothetical protein
MGYYLNLKKTNILEVIGLLVLLLAFFMQCLNTNLVSLRQDAHLYELHNKVDNIWGLNYETLTRSPNYTGTGTSYNNNDSAQNSWKTYNEFEQKNLKGLNKQISVTNCLWMPLFALGSLLVLLSKINCIQHKGK